MKVLFLPIFAFFIFCKIPLIAQETIGNAAHLQLDISNLKVLEKKKNAVLLEFDMTNSGKADIELPYETPIGIINITFETNEKTMYLVQYQHIIKEILGKESIILPIGLVKTGYQLDLLLARKELYVFEEKNKKEKKGGVKEKKKLVSKKDTLLPPDSLIVVSKDTLPTTLTDSSTTLTIINETGQNGILKAPTDSLFIGKNVVISDTTTAISSQTVDCVDFIIDSTWQIKANKKYVSVGFRVKNIGNTAALVWGNTADNNDNLAVKSYFSAVPRYTNGSIFATGMYITSEAKSLGGILQSQQSFVGEIKVSNKNKSKFTPYIILEINALQSILECTGENNYMSIK